MRPLIVLVLVLLAIGALVFAMVLFNGDDQQGPQAVGPNVVSPADPAVPSTTTLATVDNNGTAPRGTVDLPMEGPQSQKGVVRPGQGNRLLGKVEDQDGRAVAGATIKLSRDPLMGDALAMSFLNPKPSTIKPIEALTDAQGAYLFRDIAPASDYYLVASHAEFSPVQESLVFVGERGEFTGPTIVLRPGSVLTGYVRDSGNNPVPEAELFLDSAYNMTWDAPNPDRIATRADMTGYYEFKNVPYGPRNLVARAEGYGVEIKTGAELQFKGEVDDVRNIDIVLQPGMPIVGMVVDPQGVGVPNAKVSAVHFQAQTTSRGEATTDELGRFHINDLRDGAYIMMVQAQGYSQARMNRVQAGKVDVIIDLKRQACLTGRVVVPGSGSRELRVELQRTTPNNSPGQIQIFEATNLAQDLEPGGDGSFKICGVEPGYYMVLAQGPGFAPTQSPAVQVIDGQDPPPIAVTLSAGGGIRGRVLDAEGKPLVGATVVSRDNQSPDSGQDTFFGSFVTSNATERSTTTNSDGEFQLGNLAVGTYKIVVEHPNFAGNTTKDLNVLEGQTVQMSPVTLRDGATVSGVVRDQAGQGLARAFVQLYSTLEPQRSYQTRTDNDGRYEFIHVRPGSYKLSATRSSPSSSNDPFQAILDQQASEVVLSVGEGTPVQRELTLGN
jgi:uncharacterized GH25 family protein